MRSTIRRILSFFIIPACFFVLSCASVNNKTGSLSSVYVTNTKKIELLSPDNFEKNIDSLQLLNASFGKQTFSLLAFINIDNNGIFISLMNDLGTDMGNLSYNGESVFFDSSLFPKALKAEYIVADIQYAFYKSEAIEQMMSKVGLSFVVAREGQSEIRKIFDKEKCIAEITKTERECKIINYLRGYEYVLQESDDE